MASCLEDGVCLLNVLTCFSRSILQPSTTVRADYLARGTCWELPSCSRQGPALTVVYFRALLAFEPVRNVRYSSFRRRAARKQFADTPPSDILTWYALATQLDSCRIVTVGDQAGGPCAVKHNATACTGVQSSVTRLMKRESPCALKRNEKCTWLN